MPCCADCGLDSINAAAAPRRSADANEGSGEGDFVDIDAPADLDPEDAEIEVPVSATERLEKSAASLLHVLFTP
eukprot:7199427-Pyramimonas_sp.AAC.1